MEHTAEIVLSLFLTVLYGFQEAFGHDIAVVSSILQTSLSL
jgi:hypothetical protein